MKLRQMSVMRKLQWLGRYSSGNASGHHQVLWLLNGHQLPAVSSTLGPSSKSNGASSTSRHTASTSGEPLARPCWIGARTDSACAAIGTGARIDATTESSGRPRGQMRWSLKHR